MKCMICNNEKFKKMFDKVSYKRKFTFVRCTKCGFVTIHPYPTKKELAKFYSDDYDYSYMGVSNRGCRI